MGSSCSSAAAGVMPTKPGAECAICMEAIDHVDHITTNCGHAFCKGCIHEWLESNMTCPNCRTQVHTLDTPRSALRRADSRLRRERERKAHEAANMKRRAKERKAALKTLGGERMRNEIQRMREEGFRHGVDPDVARAQHEARLEMRHRRRRSGRRRTQHV